MICLLEIKKAKSSKWFICIMEKNTLESYA